MLSNNSFVHTQCLTKKRVFLILLIFSGLLCFIYQARNKDTVLQFHFNNEKNSSSNRISKAKSSLKKLFSKKKKYDFSSPNLIRRSSFEINSTDIMVYLHIQKTSGSTFGRHLVKDLSGIDCIKSVGKTYDCFRPNDNSEWLFSRFTTGWKCGLHADWTSLTECVPAYYNKNKVMNRRYFYITVVREPISRYLSEWLHVARGATWNGSYLLCNNKVYYTKHCWNGSDWADVTLDEFLDCDINPAINRQTRMLADLRAINCVGDNLTKSEMDNIMLETAKQNLMNMDFFALAEKQEESQILFEKTFNLPFKKRFTLRKTHSSTTEYTAEQMNKMKELNHLDIPLYEFAAELFNERYTKVLQSR